ncbi:O-antigen ligase family protein [Microbacterium sp. 179-I 3D4 NHS]|uniref:O-antigen ligase family protein n=1 Tax=Microbacterium sp. 179-I 3D4 NHS TaxID=3142381 RepID=UPI0039A20150
MAQYTKHPVTAPPRAPERESTGHLLLRGFVILSLLVTFAHSAVYNLLGIVGAAITLAVFTLATLAIGIPMLARRQPQPFRWRRLPWSAVAYTTFALLSIAWSQWRGASVLTWLLLAAVTVNGLFIAHVLSWPEIVRALSSAFKWILGLSLALELWVSLVIHGPLLPNFTSVPDGDIDPQWYWVRDNLLDGGRIQGIVGNANLLGIISLFALIAFGVLFAARARWRTTLALWMLLAAYFLLRTASATAFACTAAAAVVLLVALLMRRARTPGARTRIYVIAIGGTVVVGSALWLLREPLLALVGRSADLTGRSDKIWTKVLERAAEHPVFGNGFSSPWVPTDPAFDGWIVDHGLTVFHAHNMWLDALLQLGVVGLILLAAAYLGLLWRAWFFAVDRPRWDLDAERRYSPLTLLPTLFTVVLLVQGLSESTPIMLWGWMLLILLTFKLKSVPLVGVGEREQISERGAPPRRIP